MDQTNRDISQLEFRPFKETDFDDVATLCAKSSFDEVSGVYDRILFGRVMTAGSLRRSHIAKVATTGTRVVGACFGGISPVLNPGKSELADTWDPRFKEIMISARKRAKLGGPSVEERLFSRLRNYTTADVFISRGYTNSQAELNLLVVDPVWRNLGIGQRLLEDTVLEFCSHGAMGFFYVSGDKSDDAYFQKRGLTVVQEKHVGKGRGQSTIKIFGRRL